MARRKEAIFGAGAETLAFPSFFSFFLEML